MPTPRIKSAFRAASLGIAAAVGLMLVTPQSASAEHRHLRGVSIDARGVHFDFGPGYHYLHVRYPRARAYFAANQHYRNAQKFERKRDVLLEQAQSYLSNGQYDEARDAFESAIRADTRRQNQLAKLDRDRRRFERQHTHDEARHRHRRYPFLARGN
jgi:tetratricopeptide (TPR) repeat protein